MRHLDTIPEWIRAEVSDGLSILVSLRLKNTPAEDMIEITAGGWFIAFSHRLGSLASAQIDAPRIREAFRKTFPQVREWPAPVDVIERLPQRPAVAALPAPQVSEEQHRENVIKVKAMLAGLMDKLYVKRDESGDRLRRARQGGQAHGLD